LSGEKRTERKIAIVNSSTFGRYHPGLVDRLEELGEVKRFQFPSGVGGDRLAEELEGYRFIIASVTPQFDEEFFRLQRDLILIARHGIGCDNVDLEAATRSGVLVTRVAGRHERDAVAELALSLTLVCLRRIVPGVRAVREDRWEDRFNFTGRELSKLEVGVIGYGNIGSRFAELVKEGFGAEVYAYDPNVADAVIEKGGVTPLGFEAILGRSDLLSFHASLNEDNYHFIGKRQFQLMKDGVIIVNTARGELIEEEELARQVREGKVRAVGLDVAEEEPIPRDNPLLEEENVFITPHVGSYTDYSLEKMDSKMVEDVERVVRGKVPHLVVNKRVLRQENRMEGSRCN